MSKIALGIWILGALLSLNSLFFLMPVPEGVGIIGWMIDFLVSATFYWFVLWILVGVWRLIDKKFF